MEAPILDMCTSSDPATLEPGSLVLVDRTIHWDTEGIYTGVRRPLTPENTVVRLWGARLQRDAGYQLGIAIRIRDEIPTEKGAFLLEPSLLTGLPELDPCTGEEVALDDVRAALRAFAAHGIPPAPHDIIDLNGAGEWESFDTVDPDSEGALRATTTTLKRLPVAAAVVAVILGLQWGILYGLSEPLDALGPLGASVVLALSIPTLVLGPIYIASSFGTASRWLHPLLVCAILCSMAHLAAWMLLLGLYYGDAVDFLWRDPSPMRCGGPWLASALVVCTGIGYVIHEAWAWSAGRRIR